MFHVGQMVVCVDDHPPSGVLTPSLVRGCVYTIRRIDMVMFRDGRQLGLWLEETVRSVPEHVEQFPEDADVALGARRFRPVRQTSIEQFTSILNQAPQREDA